MAFGKENNTFVYEITRCYNNGFLVHGVFQAFCCNSVLMNRGKIVPHKDGVTNKGDMRRNTAYLFSTSFSTWYMLRSKINLYIQHASVHRHSLLELQVYSFHRCLPYKICTYACTTCCNVQLDATIYGVMVLAVWHYQVVFVGDDEQQTCPNW